MNEVPLLLPALVQGLVGGVVSLVVLALAAAIGGRGGVTFAELLTALAVGLAVGCVSFVLPRLVGWQIRRSILRTGAPQHSTAVSPPVHDPGEPTPARPGGDRFNRFTDRARMVLTLAQDEAQRFSHPYIGTEHLLLGLIREGGGTAAEVLDSLGIEGTKVRRAVEFIVGRGDRPVIGEIGLTAGGKRAIELAIDEARLMGHVWIGTEHLLLGLIRVDDGSIAAEVLASMAVTLDRARGAVLEAIARRHAPGGG